MNQPDKTPSSSDSTHSNGPTEKEIAAFLRREDGKVPADYAETRKDGSKTSDEIRKAALNMAGADTEDVTEVEKTFIPDFDPVIEAASAFDVHNQAIQKKFPNVTVTDEEESAFIESLILGNRPFQTTITRVNGRISMTFRTRTSYEYMLVHAYAGKLEREKRIVDMKGFNTALQTACLTLMLVEFNGKLIHDVIFKGRDTSNFDQDIEKLESMIRLHSNSYNQHVWVLLLGGLKDFEGKVLKMSAELFNLDFSEPEA